MKQLIMINGTMGVGKSATCTALAKQLPNSVCLDGDWCWDMHPFQVTQETKIMVLDNITHLLQNFLNCSVYDYVIFGWVMQEQSILDDVLRGLRLEDVQVHTFTLLCEEQTLRKRLEQDIKHGVRSHDVIERSIARLPLYQTMHTIKIDTTSNTISESVKKIRSYIKT